MLPGRVHLGGGIFVDCVCVLLLSSSMTAGVSGVLLPAAFLAADFFSSCFLPLVAQEARPWEVSGERLWPNSGRIHAHSWF